MFETNQSQNSMRIMNFCLSVACVLSISWVLCQPAYALQCGDTITTDTTLTSDLGPCPNDGLIVDGATVYVTLDFNGHAIKGSGNGNGVSVLRVSPGLTIKGSGSIANFGAGIGMTFAVGPVLVYDLVLTGNQTGMGIGAFRAGATRILNNVITAAKKGQVGIAVGITSASGETRIYQNAIRGHSIAAVTMHNSPSSPAAVDQNLITLNQNGIVVSGPALSCFSFQGNQIFGNRGTGISLGGYGTSDLSRQAFSPNGTCDAVVENNTVTLNAGSGIVVEAASVYTPVIRDNIVSFNKVNGIAVIGSNNAQPATVGGNRLVHNGTDLLWDELGSPPCWLQNIYTTSSPPSLPQCY